MWFLQRILLLILLHYQCSLGVSLEQPLFTQAFYQVSVNETFDNLRPISQPIVNVSCNSSNDTELMYTLIAEEGIPFAIDLTTGEVSVTGSIDYEGEANGTYQFTTVCSLEDNLHINDTATVIVNLLPLNEHRPVVEMTNTVIILNESTPLGLINDTLPGIAYRVVDRDQPPDTIYYNHIGDDYEGFIFNESLGGLILTKPINFDIGQNNSICNPRVMFFRIRVCDIDINTGINATMNPNIDFCPIVILKIFPNPSNDNTPMFTQTKYSTNVSESIPINSELLKVTCTDEDICEGAFSGIEITNASLTVIFSIDDNGTIKNLQPLDYESTQSYSMQLRCFDQNSSITRQREAFSTVVIQLEDVNDNPPRCALPIPANIEVGRHERIRVVHLDCEDDDEGINGELTFTVHGRLPEIANGQLTLNQTSGELNFEGEILSTANYSFYIIVSDSGDTPLTTMVKVGITVVPATTMEEPTTREPLVPKLVIIVVSVVGGLLIISCSLCCCLRTCKKSTKKTLSKPHSVNATTIQNATIIQNPTIQNQFTSNGDREVTLFFEDRVTISSSSGSRAQSYCSTPPSPQDYVVSNAMVVIDEKNISEMMEAVSYELEKFTNGAQDPTSITITPENRTQESPLHSDSDRITEH